MEKIRLTDTLGKYIESPSEVIEAVTEIYDKFNLSLKNKTTGLSFGQAIEALKQGKRVCREGWNGKGMFIFIRPSDELNISFIIDTVKSLPQSVKDFFKEKDQQKLPGEQGLAEVKFNAYLCMYAADGSIVNGWLASQTDMLSNDWCVLVDNVSNA